MGKITWGKGSEMRRLSNLYLNGFTNKNLLKLMVPKYREYLAPGGANVSTNSFSYKIDTEPSIIYQPSIIEFWGIKTSTAVPSIPQTKFNYIGSVTNTALNGRMLLTGNAQIYALRDCDWASEGSIQARALVSTDGRIMLGVSGSAYVPVLFDMELPMWCM